jgi:hypothetical protein
MFRKTCTLVSEESWHHDLRHLGAIKILLDLTSSNYKNAIPFTTDYYNGFVNRQVPVASAVTVTVMVAAPGATLEQLPETGSLGVFLKTEVHL